MQEFVGPLSKNINILSHTLVKWLSIEPMLESLTFSSLEMFDLIAIGGQSRTTKEPEFQPEWIWVEDLLAQARKSNTSVYFKENLRSRPKELPW
jgi:protein gp37